MGELDHTLGTLAEKGIVKLEGLVSVDDAQAAHRMILDLAEEHDVYSAGQWIKSQTRFG